LPVGAIHKLQPLTNLRAHAKDGQALVEAGGSITDRSGFSVG